MRKLVVIGVLLAAVTPVFAQGGVGALLSDKHTLFFIVLNLGLTTYFAGIRFNRFSVVHGPEILTTVGIFGCFIGIAMALLDFDAGNVSASVPKLLEGVKTAFWASVFGVGGSLVIRARHYFQKTPVQQVEGAPKAASMDDVVGAIQGLQRSLTGAESSSLLTQLKLMRQEQNDQLQGLRNSFETFAEKMTENGSKALIDALRSVISDFNNKITEQFGDNFKQLNQAVEKLVVWQQQYKDELQNLQAVQRIAAEDLKGAAQGIATVVAKADAFASTANSLDRLLTNWSQQYKVIEESQRSLGNVLGELKSVVPQFSKKLDELTDGMRFGVSKVQSDVAEVVRNFGVQAQTSNAEMKQLLAETLKKSQVDVNDQLLKGLETIRQSVITLDKGLQEELTKSLETLGRQLASLSEKFVADYTPLTERLREVVQLSHRVQSRVM